MGATITFWCHNSIKTLFQKAVFNAFSTETLSYFYFANFEYQSIISLFLYYNTWDFTRLEFLPNSSYIVFHKFSETLLIIRAQQTFICSTSTTEILEKLSKMLKVNNKNTRTTSLMLFWCQHISDLFLMFLLLNLNRWVFAG